MLARIAHALLIVAIIVPASALAQSSDVTFTMPLDLKQVNTDITKVAIFCEITSAAFTTGRLQKGGGRRLSAQQEFPLSAGQINMTASVVVPITGLDVSLSKTADYACMLSGFSQSLNQWGKFDPAQSLPQFRLTPPPPPPPGSPQGPSLSELSGTITW